MSEKNYPRPNISLSDLCIYFDMDGTLYEWKEINVPMPPESADMTKDELWDYVHQKVYDVLLTPGYYENLQVYPQMKMLLEFLVDSGADVRIASCSINEDTSRQKRNALKRDFPWISDDKIIFIPDGYKKQFFLEYPDRMITLLVDDYSENCIEFEKFCKASSRVTAGVIKCQNGTWEGRMLSRDDMTTVLSEILCRMHEISGMHRDI